ncbi:MAG: peptide MFS transporter [Bacteroidales bacterium]|nr:peptide MFS transporter [Bacteroidales bacterium]
MFKGHPKGLYVFLFANMGERFGYYTMIAIFTLFLQAKFGMTAKEAGHVYGLFLFGIYFIPLIGGILADKVLGFGKTIITGIVLMIVGYSLLANTSNDLVGIYVALAVISIGTGFFKGNLQAMVGRLYDQSGMGKLRDAAFSLFYMGINIGAFFAPSAAEAMNNFIMKGDGFIYSGKIPELANEYLLSGGAFDKTAELTRLAKENIIAGTYQFSNLTNFCHDYINSVSNSYNYGFGIAAISILISLIIFVAFRKHYKHIDGKVGVKKTEDPNTIEIPNLSKAQTKKRLIALGLLFLVNIFFWMSFHQNGFTLTLFARDFTVTRVSPATYTLFDLRSLLPIIAAIIGVIFMLDKKAKGTKKLIGAAMTVAGLIIAYFVISGYNPSGMPINPIKFQHFNPIFIVFITPIIIGIFAKLNKKGKEPTSPRKIGIGLILAAFSFGIMVIASLQFGNSNDLVSDAARVTPFWLIGTYFSLTISELFYSPIGISFVSKVAPPKLAGIAQGGWFASTAIGNLLAGFIGAFWDGWQMWQFFLLLVVMLTISAIFIFSIMRILENATND